jgi:UDP-N-acetylmuramate dehydrogenase
MRWADLTTLRVGGEIRDYRRASTDVEIITAVREWDDAKKPFVIVAGGSNILAADDADVAVLHIVSSGTTLTRDACSGGMVTVEAGSSWDEFVLSTIDFGFSGIEMLSGIPGSVGATPIQNVGAYGQQVSETIARVRVFDRTDQQVRTFAVADCGFGYRTSRFKEERDRYVVLDVTYQLKNATESEPIRYEELATHLGVGVGQRVTLPIAREGVLDLRRRKGMVLEEHDFDTWSAGSFFLNPIVSADISEALPDEAPRWPGPDGLVKVPAAWLIESAGFTKGFALNGAAISTKHTLALTNRGSAKALDLISLAKEIRQSVHSRFGISLEPEPRLVGLSLSE